MVLNKRVYSEVQMMCKARVLLKVLALRVRVKHFNMTFRLSGLWTDLSLVHTEHSNMASSVEVKSA